MGAHRPCRGAGQRSEGLTLTHHPGGRFVGVLIPGPVPHLDRVFDYSVPESFGDRATLGCRVRVRFAGRLVTGIVVQEQSHSDFETQPIRDVLGPQVLPAGLARLTQSVAQRYVGNWSDVVTAAVPPRHARAERSVVLPDGGLPAPLAVAQAHLRPEAEVPRVVSAAPRQAVSLPWSWDWRASLAEAVARTVNRGKRVLVVVPDDADLRAAKEALGLLDRPISVAQLSASAGAYARYRAYLNAISGQVDVVLGTRAAAFTPIPDLGLIWMWRDGDSALIDPQAPYWHAREVVGIRVLQEQCDVVFAGWSRSCEVQRLESIGWLTDTSPPRSDWRHDVGRVRLPDIADQARDPAALTARLPRTAIELVRAQLRAGPVLVQVPRRGYLPLIACAACRELVLCPACGSAAQMAPDGTVRCRCGGIDAPWRCSQCGHSEVRAIRVGSGRTAVELARAFPEVPVLRSDSEAGVITEVDGAPALVVCTPGAEPIAAQGYAAALLLDGDVLAHAPWLRAPEEALDRWLQALSKLRGSATAMLVANPAGLAAQALVRADPVGFARREYDVRVDTQLPPAQRYFALSGPGAADVAAEVEAQTDVAEVLGPLPSAAGQRWLVRCQYRHGAEVASMLDRIRRRRSEQRQPVCTMRADPMDM